MSRACWILISSLLILKATSLQAGSWTLPREIGNSNSGGGVELNATNFDGVLNETPATYAIVQFFAHWCPVCRNYKPHFEKVARLFNGPDAVHPGVIFMARVDCALKINRDLCDKFWVSHFPVLFWGPATKFTSLWKPNEAKSEIHVIDDWRTADDLLNWINQQIGSSYGLDDEKEQIPSHIADPEQAITETAVKVCAVVRELLATENNKAIIGESEFFDLGVEMMTRLMEEDSSQTITTAAYVIQKLCSEESAWKKYTRT